MAEKKTKVSLWGMDVDENSFCKKNIIMFKEQANRGNIIYLDIDKFENLCLIVKKKKK